MDIYFNKRDLTEHLKHRLMECALNNDGIVSEVFEDCAKNRVDGWLSDAPAEVIKIGKRADLIQDMYARYICGNCDLKFLVVKHLSGDIPEYMTPKYCPNCGRVFG